MLSQNEKILISLIAEKVNISRVALAQESGLTGASVTRITKGLLDKGLIEESGKVYGSRGQPSIQLKLKSDGRYSFGINFSRQTIDVSLVDLGGTILTSAREKLSNASVAEIGQQASRMSASLLETSSEIDVSKIVGYGISLPGNFTPAPRKLLQHEMFPALQNCDIDVAFAAYLDYPYWTENDATAAAIGVKQAHPEWHDFCFVHLGYGLGGGIYLDGKPFVGTHGNAGAFGVFFPYDKPRPSGLDFISYLAGHGITIHDFDEMQKLDIHSLPVQLWIERAAEQLAMAFLNISRCFDPPRIVLGGQMPNVIIEALALRAEHLLSVLRQTQAHQFMGSLPEISAVDNQCGMVGTAWIPMSNNFFAN